MSEQDKEFDKMIARREAQKRQIEQLTMSEPLIRKVEIQATGDAEADAIALCSKVIEELESGAQERLVQYLSARYSIWALKTPIATQMETDR